MIYKGDTHFKQFKKTYKCSLKTLINTPEQNTSSELDNKTKAVYIFDPGLCQLIFSSRLKLAYKFNLCPLLNANFREEELISMGKSGFIDGMCVKY